LNDVLKIVINDLELNIEEQKVIIETTPLPVIEAIPSQMAQLFNNILNNAIKFKSLDRKPQIIISCRELDRYDKEKLLLPEKIFYEISIQDNGIGFEQEYAEKVFQVFQRLHGKAEYPGSGIGLAICKKLLKSTMALFA